MSATTTTTPDVARRTALAAQGFAHERPAGRIDVRHLRRVLRHVGVVQLDSVNVVSRAHYLPFWSRLGAYDREALDAWAHDGHELFEYWAHAASLVPAERHRLLRWRMAATEPWERMARLEDEHPGYVEHVFQEVRRSGPIRVGDLDDPGERSGSWWGWGNGKVALEWLFAKGRITSIRDANFHRIYDLPERLLPEEALAAPTPAPDEAWRQLLLLSARHHGIGTADDLGDYYRLDRSSAYKGQGRARVRRMLEALADEGALERVRVGGWSDIAYRHPDATIPRAISATTLLSPFDSLVWHRDRTERLFGFHYRIEIYVPKAKRRFGYYVLPFMMAGELVGRVDLKADRKAGVLRVPGAFVEPRRDASAVSRALAEELHTFARWLGLDEVHVGSRGKLAPSLRRAL